MVEDLLRDLLPEDLRAFATIGDLPSFPANAISLVLFDGVGNDEFFGERFDSTIYNYIVKVKVRNNSYEMAKLWIQGVKESFHRYTGLDILSIFMVSAPRYLGRDVQKYHEFQVTFIIKTKE